MLSNKYRVYVNDTISLVRSMVFKHKHTIESQNKYLYSAGDELSNDPVNWKYYLNISGEYYQGTTGLYNDVIMTVPSLDRVEDIDFTIENLLEHSFTRTIYRKRGEEFRKLISRYPEQETLIVGILFPIDKTVAIEAEYMDLLYYDTSLIENQELTLIDSIQEWVKIQDDRWNVEAFNLADLLYSTAWLSQLYMGLVPTIINFRLKRCKTLEVHSFHVWLYLGGYFRLDLYQDRIYINQALWLYRNFPYLISNSGTSGTLDYIEENFIEPYGLSLFNHTAHIDSDKINKEILDGELYLSSNETTIGVTPYNEIVKSNIPDESIESSTEDMLDLASNNRLYLQDDVTAFKYKMKHCVNSELPLGLIKCSTGFNFKSSMLNEYLVKLNHYLYLSSKELYKSKLNVLLRSDMDTVKDISMSESVAIILYLVAKYSGEELINIPNVTVHGIPNDPGFDGNYYSGMVTEWGDSYTNTVGGVVRTDVFDAISSNLVLPKAVNSVTEFKEHVKLVLSREYLHNLNLINVWDIAGREQMYQLIDKFYLTETLTFTKHTTYNDLWNDIRVDLTDLTPQEAKDLSITIMQLALGDDLNTVGLGDPFDAMVEVLKTLTSYTTQFVLGTNSYAYQNMDYAFIYPMKTTTTVTSIIEPMSIGSNVVFNSFNITDNAVLLNGSDNGSITDVSTVNEYILDFGTSSTADFNITNTIVIDNGIYPIKV